MVNTEIRLIIFFAAKDGEALYSQQKQDWELTVAHIMNSLLQNSDLNWRKSGKTTRPFIFLTLFSWTPKSLQMVTAAIKLKDAYSLEEKQWQT